MSVWLDSDPLIHLRKTQLKLVVIHVWNDFYCHICVEMVQRDHLTKDLLYFAALCWHPKKAGRLWWSQEPGRSLGYTAHKESLYFRIKYNYFPSSKTFNNHSSPSLAPDDKHALVYDVCSDNSCQWYKAVTNFKSFNFTLLFAVFDCWQLQPPVYDASSFV